MNLTISTDEEESNNCGNTSDHKFPHSSFEMLLLFEMVIATIGTIATASWIFMGGLFQRAYTQHFRVVNIVLALVLLECAWSML